MGQPVRAVEAVCGDRVKGEGMFIVKLERGVYLADGEGDPARTLVKENAKLFSSMLEAVRALTAARKYRPFEKACIEGGGE